MSKRFTDTEKWDDVWFQELPSKYQKLWIYICDKCDCAGIWKVNKTLAEFQLKETLSLDNDLKVFNDGKERIKKLAESKWFITGFIRFQVTTLRKLDSAGKINRVHAPIYASLEVNGLDYSFYELEENRGSTEALQSLLARQDKDKDKDKDKEKESSSVFEDFWKLYPSRNGKKLLKKDAFKQFAKLDEATYPDILQAVRNYVKSGQMPRDAVRFFKDDYWREWIAPVPIAEKLSVKTEMPDRTTQPRWQYPPEVQALVKGAIPRGSK